KDAAAFVEADLALHQAVAEASHNKLLHELYADLSSSMREAVEAGIGDNLGEDPHIDHTRAIEAIIAGDPELAVAETAAYLRELIEDCAGLPRHSRIEGRVSPPRQRYSLITRARPGAATVERSTDALVRPRRLRAESGRVARRIRRSVGVGRADRRGPGHPPQVPRVDPAPAAARWHRRLQARPRGRPPARSEEHTSELQSRENLVCRLL